MDVLNFGDEYLVLFPERLLCRIEWANPSWYGLFFLNIALFGPLSKVARPMNGELVFTLLKENQTIADIGSGINAAPWWAEIKSGSTIDAFDLFNETASSKDHITFFKQDVTKLEGEDSFKEKYDLVIADHIMEHVEDLDGMAKSLNWVVKPGGYIHIGVPDASNFTDIFYRLIHRFQSGGHIQQFTHDDVVDFMKGINCELIKSEIWEDDWVWFEKCFSLEYNKVEGVTQEQINFLVQTFRKELTSDKGYIYGHEFVFKKN